MRQGKNLVFTEVWKENCCRSVNDSVLSFSLQQNNLCSEEKKLQKMV